MLRSPWELDVYTKYQQAHLMSVRRRSSQAAQAEIGSRDRLARLRRWVGTGLIQVGSTIAGFDAAPALRAADLARP